MMTIRQPAVAGVFYPLDRQELHADIAGYLKAAASPPGGATVPNEVPKAVIVPHAGYIYSGPVAAAAYARLQPAHAQIHRVVLLGPSHRVPFHGLATSSAEAYATPLGPVSLDREAINTIRHLPQVHHLDEAHRMEHSLEVHLPFLLEILDDFKLVPLVVGDASAAEVAEVLEKLWGGPETLIVISSDLSHYNSYATAKHLDAETSRAIIELREHDLGSEDACGFIPVSGLLRVAKAKGLQAEIVDLRNSGDTAGPRDRVVGYGAYVFH